MVALFNGVGGGAVALIAWVEFRNTGGYASRPARTWSSLAVRGDHRLDLLLGLDHRLRQAPGAAPGPADHARARAAVRQPRAGAARRRRCAVAIAAGHALDEILFVGDPASRPALLGIFVVLPIGGADMPVVISLLNAFTGLARPPTGIALDNTALIVAGMLVGASGSILTKLMAEAMNRSIPNDRRRRLRRRRRGRRRGRRGRARGHRALDQRRRRRRSSSPTRARS